MTVIDDLTRRMSGASSKVDDVDDGVPIEQEQEVAAASVEDDIDGEAMDADEDIDGAPLP